MWQCEDSHSSTHTKIENLLGLSLPAPIQKLQISLGGLFLSNKVSTGEKSNGMGFQPLLIHNGKQRWVEIGVCQQSIKNNQHIKSVEKCAFVTVNGEIWDVTVPICFLQCLGQCFLPHGEKVQGKAAQCMSCLPWVLLPASGLRVASHRQHHDRQQHTSNCSFTCVDVRNIDLSQRCGIQAGCNIFMDLHRYK